MPVATEGARLRLYQEAAEPVNESRLSRGVRGISLNVGSCFVIVCLLLGLGIRSYCYFRAQSLWIDEAMLALNVIHRSTAELWEPLDLNQGAPVGFLLLSKLSIKLLGSTELGLRALAFLSGLAGLWLFVPLAYQLLPLGAARLAIACYSLSPYLVGYSAEFKQYELDATLTVLLLLVNWRLIECPSRGRLILSAMVGAGCLWLSHPALFTLCAVSSVLLLDAVVLRDRSRLVERLGVAGLWAGSFLLNYWLFLSKLGLNSYLLNYWSGKFLPLPPTSLGNLGWIVHHILEFFDKPAGFGTPEFAMSGLAAFIAACGGIQLLKTRWRLLLLLVGPFLFALAASAFKKYPFAGRLLLFAVPLGLLLVALGAMQINRLLNTKLAGAGWLLIVLLMLAPLVQCKDLLEQPLHGEQTREMLAHIHAEWQSGDRLYVYYGAVPVTAYYHERYPIPTEAVLLGRDNRHGPFQVFFDELNQQRGSGRLWVLVAHRQPQEVAAILAYLEANGSGSVSRQGQDAAVYSYTLRPAVSVVRAGN